jgi:ribosome-associated protein
MDPGADGWLHFAGGIRIRPERLVFTTSRAGGPGGQHVNTTESRVILHVRVADFQGGDPGFADRLRRIAGSRLSDDDVLVLHCQEERSQQRNRELVGQRLRELVTRAARRPRTRRATRPTRASVERRLEAKSRRGKIKNRRQPPDENA